MKTNSMIMGMIPRTHKVVKAGRAGSPLPAANVVGLPHVSSPSPGAHGVTRPTACAGRAGSPLPTALFVLLLLLSLALAAQAQPVVSSVTTSQTPGATDVTIGYSISDATATAANVYVLASTNGGNAWTLPVLSLVSGSAQGLGVAVSSMTASKSITWHAGTDFPGQYTPNCKVRVVAADNGMVLVPAGNYTRGTPAALGDTDITDAPPYPVYVNPFLMDSNLISGGVWNYVLGHASASNLVYDLSSASQNAGSDPSFFGGNHPVQSVNWYDVVKWCNARSELEGLTPVYYTNASCAANTIYRIGHFDAVYLLTNAYGTVANGYRLPTEAEWEKAARGGTSGERFPWAGNTITTNQALYTYDFAKVNDLSGLGYGSDWQWYYTNSYDYDVSGGVLKYFNYTTQPLLYLNSFYYNFVVYSPTSLFNDLGTSISHGATLPIGSYPANGYNFYDMAGNVNEWCWDWYGSGYYASGQSNPTGPSPSMSRVIRGGGWDQTADKLRCAARQSASPGTIATDLGFRCVRGF